MAKTINKYTKLKEDIAENALFLGLPVRRKAHCFSVLVMLLKHANYKTGECYPRLSTIAKPLGLSKVTVYKCINIMIKGGILLKVRLPSTNLYKINPEFVYSDIKTVNITKPSDIKTVKGGIKTVNGDVKTVKVLVEHNIEHYIEQSIESINNIINNNRGNKDTIVYLISRSIPLPELNNLLIQNIHTYYVRLAIDKHRELLRQKNLLPEALAKTQISQALKNNSKQRSASYKAKVEYNKRNNLDWQGKPKVR
jgi:predicted transcriptional regulator